MTTEQQIWSSLKSKGLTDFAVAGIMGNLQAESSLRSNNLEDTRNPQLGSDAYYTSAVDNGSYSRNSFINDGAGYGLAQWTTPPERKAGLYDLCKSNHKSISDIECQLTWLCEELKSKKLFDSLNKTTSVKDASNIFLKKFEAPANSGISVQNYRASLGQKFYDSLRNTQTKTQGGNSGTMKYSSSNAPLVCMQTNSTCYKGTSKMTIKGVLWHSTGANNPNIKRYVQPSENDPNYAKLMSLIGNNPNKNDWNHIPQQAGLNAWIGKLADGSIASVQTMPWDYKPWGCGSGSKGSCNNGWIQFEICEDNLNDKTYFEKAYQEACELTAYLCKAYNLNPKGSASLNGVAVPVILCHQDSAQLGLGSNHADVYHWFTKFGKSMNDVRNDVAKLMSGSSNIVIPNSGSSSNQYVTPSQTGNHTEILRKGSEGPEVEELQQKLIKLGYSCGSYGADGDFGNSTLAAVVKFQKDHGLDDDGEVGPLTWRAIEAALIGSSTPQTYRVRKAWNQPATQIGAFTKLENAKACCDRAGEGYSVFNNSGTIVYTKSNPVNPSTPDDSGNQSSSVKPAKTYSGVVLGSSSKDETGSYRGGRAGDQTGKEVWTLNWYDQGWTEVLRPKDPVLAEKLAVACEAACANDNIGYDQNERNTLLAEAKKVNYDISKITTPCECDCSSLVSAVCVCAGLPESIFFAGGNGRVTWNIGDACLQTGKFVEITDSKYLRQKDYLKRGDILCNRNQHVVMVLSDGDLAEKSASTTIPDSGSSSSTNGSYLVRVIVDSLNVRSGPSKSATVVAQVKKNQVYTIVAEEGGFGKLKSGVGWIDLSYVVKK